MASLKSVKKLLRELQYTTKVEKLSEGCVVTSPKWVHSYILSDTGFIFCDENLQNYLYRLNPRAIRVGISVHIIRTCRDINFNPSLIDYFVGNKRVKSLEDIFAAPKDLESEKLLVEIMTDIIKTRRTDGWIEEADYYGLKSECEALIDIWEER